MLEYLPKVDGAVKGMGWLAGQNTPFVGFMKRHWLLVAVAGIAMVAKTRQRHKKGDLDLFNSMADLGMVLCPLVGLATLDHLAKQDVEIRALMMARTPEPGTIPTPPMPT